MGSRKEEERNEKIIRGLMKLPPNRRCINCNSLGPQYVCTNFWSFVCMTCGGIHREFTHRVKSVSMSKFTSQEVEALQNGGNQRAREMYLKDWDMQTQRLPNSSNAEKIREFIKNVYVDKRYAGGKNSDKPPRDLQSLRNHGDETRRASSYHSYSQSPPYDYQYEDRRYGKHVTALSRKPGSDRGHYVGRFSNLIYSPGCVSDQAFEDRFANEGSAPRVSDYSVSSGGDPFRSETQSPNFQNDGGFSSPSSQRQRDVLSGDAHHQPVNLLADPNTRRDFPHPQRTKSSGSIGSFDSNSMSFISQNSSSLVDVVSEPEQAVGTFEDIASNLPHSSLPINYGATDLFNAPAVSAPPPIDLFQLPTAASVPSVDMFQTGAVPSMDLHQPPQTTQPLDLFTQATEQLPVADSISVPKNEGWATFDTHQPVASDPATGDLSVTKIPRDGDFPVKYDQVSSLNTTMQWPLFENSSALGAASSVPSSWHEGLLNVQAPSVPTSSQSWNAFGDSAGCLPLESVEQNNECEVAYLMSATVDQSLGVGVSEGSTNYEIQRTGTYDGVSASAVLSDFGTEPTHAPSTFPLTVDKQSHAADLKSINPFDLPYDSDVEQSDMFLDMSSLQAALPSAQLPSSFLGGGVSQPWFPQNPVAPYIPTTSQASLAYMAGQAPSSSLPNVPAQGPVASIGGNPFA